MRLTLLFVVFFASSLRAELVIDERSFFWHEQPSWSVPMSDPTTLIIENPGGAVTVSVNSGTRLGFSLPVIRMFDDNGKLTVKIVERAAGKWLVSVRYPLEIPVVPPVAPGGLLLPSPMEVTGESVIDVKPRSLPYDTFAKGAHLAVSIPREFLNHLSIRARGDILVHDVDGSPEKPMTIHAESSMGETKMARVIGVNVLLAPNRFRVTECATTIRTIGYADQIKALFH